MSTITRIPISVQRTPITFITDNKLPKSGGWYVWSLPDEEPPNWKLEKNERVLWCPWCGEWAVYKKVYGDDVFRCQGYCGWANTGEYYVRHINKIWYEDIPLGDLRKLEIPRPRGKR